MSNTQFALPSGADGVTVTPNTTNWQNSAWVELTAALSAESALTGITARGPTTLAAMNLEIDIGVGDAGNEVPIATLKGINFTAAGVVGNGNYWRLPVGIAAMPNGARVATRMRKSGGSNSDWVISITGVALPITGTYETTAQPLRCVPNASNLVTVSTGGSTWTYGTLEQLVSATATAIEIDGLVIFPTNNSLEFDAALFIGENPDETELLVMKGQASNGSCPWIYMLATPRGGIPAGSRITAGVRGTQTTYDFNIGFLYREAA